MSGQFQGNVRAMSGQCQGNVRAMSGQCQGNVRAMSGQCQGNVRAMLLFLPSVFSVCFGMGATIGKHQEIFFLLYVGFWG
jgi:hypothetical protein